MAVMTGTVEQISEKEGKFGPMISYKINGDWMLLKGAKFKPRDIQEGSTVEVDFVTNERGYKDINKGGLKLASAATTAVTAPVGKGGSPVPYKDPRQTIISTQAALNTAIAFVTVAAANGVLPAMTGKANDKLALFRTWVLNEAAGFYKLSTGEELVLPEAAAELADAALPVKPKAKKPVAVIEDDDGEDEYPDDE